MNSRIFSYLFFSLFTVTVFGQIESVGLIGSATPFGWDADTNMIKVDTIPHMWTMTITLTDGAAKFRANGNWDVNWGATDFPSGIGTQGGPDIPVFAGDYIITFNDSTGAYNFAVQSPMGIIGDATANGWDEDTNMWEDSNGVFFITIDLTNNKVKFRLNDMWNVQDSAGNEISTNWGGEMFPMDTATLNGPDIGIPKAGTYFVTFDTSSLIYNFKEIIAFDSVMIIGDATAGGWEMGTLMTQDASNPDIWKLSTSLIEGGAQFTANGGSLIWGGSDFPEGTAVVDGDTIPVAAGDYQIELNTESGEYKFLKIEIYESIGIIGSATVNGWEGDDIDLERDAADSSSWSLRIELLDGEAKFRANNDWEVANWGGGDFPTGVATLNGPNIPITAGEYLISFNSITGAYNFELIVEYDAISLVGRSGPFGDWPGDDSSRDLFMSVSPDDPQSWSAEEVTLTTWSDFSDGGVKFRADTSWTINWGAADFPAGTGTQDGANIECIGGTYSVSFNSATGEYLFGAPSSTHEILRPSAIKLFPNPAYTRINLDISELGDLSGDVQLNVMDMNGKLVKREKRTAQSIMSINVSQLETGNYLIQVIGDGYLFGKKFSIVR